MKWRILFFFLFQHQNPKKNTVSEKRTRAENNVAHKQSKPKIVMETRTRSGGKRSMVVEGGDEPYFKTKEEIDVFLTIFPHNEEIDKNVLREIMVRAILPASGHRRNIRYTNTLKVIDKRSGTLESGTLERIEDMKFGQIRILMTPNRYELYENFKTANYHSYQAVTTNDMSEGKLHITSTCIRSLYETTTNDLYENGTTLAHKNAVTTLGGHNGATVQKYYPKRRLENSVKNAQAVMSVVYNNNSTPASVPDSGEPPAPTSGGSESDDDIAPVRASYDTGSHTHQIYDDDEAPPALIPLRNFRNNEDLLPALVNDDSDSDDDEEDDSDKNT